MLKKVLLASVPAALLLVVAAPPPAHALLESQIIRDVKQLEPQGTDFNAALAREYRAFAIFENDEMWDYLAGEHFADKAIRAAAGQAVAPERVEDWNIPPAHRQELTQGRARLMTALDGGAATSAPQLAAIAQARFDCWVEQQEEDWQPAHIAACKGEFEQAMDALESAVAPPPVAEVPAAVPQVLVFFDWDRYDITPEAASILRSFVANAQPGPDTSLTIEGHTDTSGSATYNMGLSERRADAVRNELMQAGLAFDRYRSVTIVPKGQTEPLVSTGDGVREPQNRRVTLIVDHRPAQTSEVPTGR